MGRRLILLTIALVALGCTGPQICPDGEPVYNSSDIDQVFPPYVREYEGGLSVVSKVLADTQVGVTFKTKAARLREELDQKNIELEGRYKALLHTLQMAPCDKVNRGKVIDFITDVKSQTKRIPDRLKELHDESAAKLHSEVSNLLRYPDTAKDLTKPSVFEVHLANKVPRRLFDLLSTYNDEAILNVRNVGSALRDYKIGYYGFRQKVTALHEALMPRIGELATMRLTTLWPGYFSYAVLRFSGTSQAQIIKGNPTDYVTPWDDYEQVFIQFSKDKSVARAFSEAFTMHKTLEADVEKIKLAI